MVIDKVQNCQNTLQKQCFHGNPCWLRKLHFERMLCGPRTPSGSLMLSTRHCCVKCYWKSANVQHLHRHFYLRTVSNGSKCIFIQACDFFPAFCACTAFLQRSVHAGFFTLALRLTFHIAIEYFSSGARFCCHIEFLGTKRWNGLYFGLQIFSSLFLCMCVCEKSSSSHFCEQDHRARFFISLEALSKLPCMLVLLKSVFSRRRTHWFGCDPVMGSIVVVPA